MINVYYPYQKIFKKVLRRGRSTFVERTHCFSWTSRRKNANCLTKTVMTLRHEPWLNDCVGQVGFAVWQIRPPSPFRSHCNITTGCFLPEMISTPKIPSNNLFHPFSHHISRDNPPNSRNKQKTIMDLTNVTKICKYHFLSPLWVSLQLFQAFSFLLCWTELQQRRLGLLHKRGISLAFYNMWFIINTKVGTLFLSASSFSLFIKYQDQPLSLVSSQLLNGAPLAGSSPPAKVLEILWINPLQFNLSGRPPSLLFIFKAAMTNCSYITTK